MAAFFRVQAGLAAMTVLMLGACANTQETTPSASTIIWNTDGVTTTGSGPTGTQPVPGSASEPAPTTTGRSMGPPPSDGCREYSQTVTIDGRPQQVYGRACPQPDGSWRLNPPRAVPAPSAHREGAERYAVPVYPAYPAYGPYGPSVFLGSTFVFSGRHHRYYR